MKVDRSIDSVNECQVWRKYSSYSFVQNMTGLSGQNVFPGVIFAPYVPHIFTHSNLYPHVIKPFNLNPEENEIKTKIRYRQFKRFRATRR